jgi:hypothetical protein
MVTGGVTLTILAFAALSSHTVDRITRQVAVGAAQDLGQMLAEWSSRPLERHDWASLNSLARLHTTNPGLLFVTFVVRDDELQDEGQDGELRAIRTVSSLKSDAVPAYDLPEWAIVRVPVWASAPRMPDRQLHPIGEVHLGIDPDRSHLLLQQAHAWFSGTAATLGGLLLLLMIAFYHRVTRENRHRRAEDADGAAGAEGAYSGSTAQRGKCDETAKLRDLAARDPLTGLYNRRHFNDVFERRFEEAQRYGDPVCLALMDLDDFKRVNDH